MQKRFYSGGLAPIVGVLYWSGEFLGLNSHLFQSYYVDSKENFVPPKV